jgi:hypothetical protein
MMRGRRSRFRAGAAAMIAAAGLTGTAAAAETPQEAANRKMLIDMWQGVLVNIYVV